MIGAGRLLAGEPLAHAAQTALQTQAHHVQLAPVRFVAEAVRAVAEQLFAEQIGFGFQAGEQFRRRLTEQAGKSQLMRQRSDAHHVFGQGLARLQAQRQRRGLGFDIGIAVTVAADPGTETQQAGNADVLRAFRIHAAHALFQMAVHHRDRLEQTLFEVIKTVADLVAHLRAMHAHLVGLPQHLDLILETLGDFLALILAETQIVEQFAGDEDAAQRFHDGAALGFGRVSGEHRNVGQSVEQDLELFGTHAIGAQIAQRGVEGTGPQRPATAHLPAPQPVLISLFGDVDQTEIDIEGAHHVRDDVRLEFADQSRQTRAGLRIVLAVQIDVTLAQRLHGLQHLAAGLRAQHLAQQIAEQLDAGAQFLVAGLFGA